MVLTRLNRQETLQKEAQLTRVAERVFGAMEPDYIAWRVEHMPDVSTFVVEQEGEWLGFKCGYGMTRRRYYSWLGGVVPESRGEGIASRLMLAQHEWLEDSEYEVVETHVRQSNSAMIRSNQKFGFVIVGRFLKSGEVNLIMQAPLGSKDIK